MLDRLKSPLGDPPLPSLARGLPADRKSTRGPHILLMHQHEQTDAGERVALLENVVAAYYLYFASLGLDLATPTHRIPSMWFARKDDYLAFLRAEGAVTFLNTRGYHHLTRGLVVAFDCRDEAVRTKSIETVNPRGRAELDRFAAQIDRIPIKGPADRPPAGRGPKPRPSGGEGPGVATLRRQSTSRKSRLELARRELDWAMSPHTRPFISSYQLSKLVPGQRFVSRTRVSRKASRCTLSRSSAADGAPRSALDDPRPRLPQARRPAPTRADHPRRRFRTRLQRRRSRSVIGLRFSTSAPSRPAVFVALLDGLRAPAASRGAPGERAGEILHGLIKSDEDDRWRGWMKKVLAEAEPKAAGAHPH